MRVDIFCRVIDNYGDAGVAWRLARELAGEHGVAVTLRLDAMPSLARIVPGLSPHAREAQRDGVRIVALDDAAPAPARLPDGIVEAFGCGLPAPWLGARVQAGQPPVWVTLEYLTAEPWVEEAHGLPSPHPRLPLTRHFFFPGFTARTGGLLRERGLLARRDAAREQPRRPRLPAALQPAVAAALERAGTQAPLVSMFCYPQAPVAALLAAWTAGDAPLACVVPQGVADAAVAAWAGAAVPSGDAVTRGALSLAVVPFVSQEDYDRLLWSCDVNFVRGEDSFVRAQWAGAPFVWHAYPQDDAAHRVKVAAFLARYLDGAPPQVREAVAALWDAWNAGCGAGASPSRPTAADVAGAWAGFRACAAEVGRHDAAWTARLAALPELAASLLEFMRDRL
jgi:uncharacterized repeat protein (TIGR03837 family)